MTSLRLPAPTKTATSRSTPNATPPWGGAPEERALNRNPNFRSILTVIQAEQAKDPTLQRWIVITNAARAELDAIEHQVVGQPAHTKRLLLESILVLRMRHDERMVVRL